MARTEAPAADQVMKEIEAGKIRPVYYLAPLGWGDPVTEPYFVTELLKAFRESTVAATADFNLDRFDASSCEPSQITIAAETFPMMAKYRLVIVRNASSLDNERGHEVMLRYLEKPASTCVLVMEGDKPDGRKKLAKALQEMGAYVDVSRPKEEGLSYWIRRFARLRGRSVSDGAAELFIERIGADITALDQAIEVAALVDPDSKEISEETAARVIASTRGFTAFDLFDAITNRDLPAVYGILEKLSESGEREYPMLLGGLHWSFRQMRRMDEMRSHGMSGDDICRALKINFRRDEKIRAAARWKGAGWDRFAERFYELDRQLKGAPVDRRLAMERLLVELTSRKAS